MVRYRQQCAHSRGGLNMAQKVTVALVDDLDGTDSADVKTVEFSLDGVAYQIDLRTRNASGLRKVFADYVAAARRTGGRGGKPRGGNPAAAATPPKAAVDREQSGAIRAWARKNGHEIAERGRIPVNVIEAYNGQAKAPA